MNNIIKNINWINVAFVDMPNSTSVTIEILVKAGSIYENIKTNWISHFLEHMFFKWWIKFNSAKIVAEKIDEIGWDFNAFTAEEYAGYYVKCAPEYVKIWLEVLSDMLVNAQFPKDEIEKEKWVVIQEIMMYEDMPSSLVMDKWKRFYYWDNSYGWSILWPVENVNSFTQEDLFNHKNSLYTKDNIVIVMAWNLWDITYLENLIFDYFDKLSEKSTISKPMFTQVLPTTNSEFYDKKTEQTHMCIWSKWFSTFDNERYAANLLWIILGWNMSSRLYSEIREKKWLCYYIRANHYSNYDDGTFMIRAWIDKDKFDFWLQSIYEEISKIANWDISEEEFSKALSYIKWKTKMWIETSDQMTSFIGEPFLLKWKFRSLEEILGEYEKLKLSDITSITNRLLEDKLYLYYIK